MDRIWAPWRMKYISGDAAKETPEGACVLCLKWQEGRDEENLVLHRGETCFIMLNLFPYTNGHLLVLPARHTSELSDLTRAERLELFDLVDRGTEALAGSMNPHGYNLGMNLGRCAGAGIEDHLHVHVVPRWNGDTNFMSVLGEARVISEGLAETYRKLKHAFAKGG